MANTDLLSLLRVGGADDWHKAVFGRARKAQPSSAPVILIEPSDDELSALDCRKILDQLTAEASSLGSEGAVRKLLARSLTAAQMEAVRIFSGGRHEADGGVIVVFGDARLEATGTSIVLAFGGADVVARNGCRIYAANQVTLTCYDRVFVDARDEVTIRGSYGAVRGRASGRVTGTAHGRSQWIVAGDTVFDGLDCSALFVEGSATVRAYGNCRVRGRGRCRVELFGKTVGWFEGEASVTASEQSVSYCRESVSVRQGQQAQVNRVPAGRALPCAAWPKF